MMTTLAYNELIWEMLGLYEKEKHVFFYIVPRKIHFDFDSDKIFRTQGVNQMYLRRLYDVLNVMSTSCVREICPVYLWGRA